MEIMQYEQLYRSESLGSKFSLGVDINIASPCGATEGVKRVARQAADLLEQAMMRDFYATDKTAQESAVKEKLELLACFPEGRIFVRAIPNGYCHKACCEHLPWYEVTTRIGVIKIGWRKRVIQIDWTGSIVTAKAEELFPDEDVTKDGRLIHAWSCNKAREYISKLLEIEKDFQKPSCVQSTN